MMKLPISTALALLRVGHQAAQCDSWNIAGVAKLNLRSCILYVGIRSWAQGNMGSKGKEAGAGGRASGRWRVSSVGKQGKAITNARLEHRRYLVSNPPLKGRAQPPGIH